MNSSTFDLETNYCHVMNYIRQYIIEAKFPGALLGISGGLDSGLVVALACDALGPEHVKSYVLKSRYTSQESIDYAQSISKRLGVEYLEASIQPVLEKFFAEFNFDPEATEENLQSRIRSVVLMAYSNQNKHLMLCTGNKSEKMVGYCTLYGDTCGAIAPITDIYKTQVFELAKWRNQNIPQGSKCNKIEIIPVEIINRKPTAELKFGQTDQDSLPPYQQLDSILKLLVDQKLRKEEIIDVGHDCKVVEKVAELVKKSEYKRLQLPPGPQAIIN